MSIKDFLLQSSIWIVLLPLVVGILLFKRLEKESKIIWGTVALATAPQILTAFIMNTTALTIMYNLYSIVEFTLFFLFFRIRLKGSFELNQILNYSAVLYSIMAVVDVICFGVSNRFLNELVCFNNLMYILWVLLFFRHQYSSDTIEISSKNPGTWYLLGLAFYAPCTLLIFSFYHYIRDHPLSFLKNLWVIHNCFNIIMYVFFAIGLYIDATKKKYLLS
jgi:hypothetical protein